MPTDSNHKTECNLVVLPRKVESIYLPYGIIMQIMTLKGKVIRKPEWEFDTIIELAFIQIEVNYG